MQPDLPQPNQNPYDFIMSSGQPQKPGRAPGLPSGGNGQLQRLIFVGAGAVVLLIIGIIIFNILSSAGKGSVTMLKNLVAEQTELIRVADLGVVSAKGNDAKNLAATTALTVRTMQQRTTKLLSLKGEEVTPAERASKMNDKTDAALDTADLNNRYDQAFIEYMTGALTRYQGALKTAYDANTGANDRDVLSSAFTSTALIIEHEQL